MNGDVRPAVRPQPRRVAALVYAAVWLPLLAVDITLYAAQGADPWRAARGATCSVLPLALLGVPALRLSEQLFELVPAGWRRAAWLGAITIVYAIGAISATLFLLWLDVLAFGSTRPYQISYLYSGWQALMNSLVFAALAGVAYARVQSRRAAAESARAARAESLKARADLALLRSQLNPHFVLNVLHSLLGLVRRDPARAERALEELGGLLGFGLRVHRENRDRVALRDEWAFVAAYLDLEKLRLGERLDLDLEAAPETLGLLVPSFALQPLVENAIVHAIAPRAQGGRLEVRARREGERLRLTVRDDGPGLGGAIPEIANGGLGLRLLRERLAALYGDDAILTLAGASGGGLAAELDLPLEPAAEEAR